MNDDLQITGYKKFVQYIRYALM